MSIRIRCSTTVDITATGVKNRFYKSRMPFYDDLKRLIDTESAWQESRAQQSNWETVNQLISLRTLTENIDNPCKTGDLWQFEFDAVDPAAVTDGFDPVGLLKQDCDGVPVAQTPDNLHTNMLKTTGEANVWFEVIADNRLNISV